MVEDGSSVFGVKKLSRTVQLFSCFCFLFRAAMLANGQGATRPAKKCVWRAGSSIDPYQWLLCIICSMKMYKVNACNIWSPTDPATQKFKDTHNKALTACSVLLMSLAERAAGVISLEAVKQRNCHQLSGAAAGRMGQVFGQKQIGRGMVNHGYLWINHWIVLLNDYIIMVVIIDYGPILIMVN